MGDLQMIDSIKKLLEEEHLTNQGKNPPWNGPATCSDHRLGSLWSLPFPASMVSGRQGCAGWLGRGGLLLASLRICPRRRRIRSDLPARDACEVESRHSQAPVLQDGVSGPHCRGGSCRRDRGAPSYHPLSVPEEVAGQVIPGAGTLGAGMEPPGPPPPPAGAAAGRAGSTRWGSRTGRPPPGAPGPGGTGPA